MGQKVIMFSDLSGAEVGADARMGKVIVEYGDARKGIYCLDATDAEIEELAGKGRRTNRSEAAKSLGIEVAA
jgi:hypothetical protein